MEAVRNREAEVDAACLEREKLIKINVSSGSSQRRTS
jgi:hypothetical protein